MEKISDLRRPHAYHFISTDPLALFRGFGGRTDEDEAINFRLWLMAEEFPDISVIGRPLGKPLRSEGERMGPIEDVLTECTSG